MTGLLRTCAFALGVAAFAAVVHADSGTTQQLGGGAGTQQLAPAVNGSGVVWTNFDGTEFDIYYEDVSVVGATPSNLTASLGGNQFLEDIYNGSVVFTNTSPQASGSDIMMVDTASGAISNVAGASSTVTFARPSIAKDWIVFERITTQANNTQIVDIDLYDRNAGSSPGFQVTNDPAEQHKPRVSGNAVVYEDYNANPSVASVALCQLSLTGCTTALVSTVGREPDVDGDNVVYIGSDGTNDQIFLYSITNQTTRQLTTAASSKSTPRVSGNRVVWSDARSGNLAIYSYDLGTATESLVVGVSGVDVTVGDIDGDRLVYATSSGSAYLYTYPAPAPSDLPLGCDPGKTDLVDGPRTMTQSSRRPVYGNGQFATQAGRTYYICVDDGRADGSGRTMQILASVDNGVVLSPADFRPNANPPKHVAAKLSFQNDRRGHDGAPLDVHEWGSALFGAPGSSITVSIRVAK